MAQLCPPLKNFIRDATRLLASHICQLADPSGNISDRQRDSEVFLLTSDVRQDLLLLAAVIADTFEHPLTIMDPDPQPPLCAVQIYTDASGRIAEKSSPSLGIFSPPRISNILQLTAYRSQQTSFSPLTRAHWWPTRPQPWKHLVSLSQ